MKLKKKVKRNVIIVFVVIIACVVAGLALRFISNKSANVKEVKVLNKIDDYGYELKDSKSKKYQSMFSELKDILSADKVDEEKYVKQISKMFIYDFYSLADKTAKTDVGGVDFLYDSVVTNFVTNAESTYYRYVESDIYGQRNQNLPTVDKVTIDSVDTTSFEYGDKTDEEAYQVEVSWTYTTEDYADYQQKATLVFVHNGKKLDLVELS